LAAEGGTGGEGVPGGLDEGAGDKGFLQGVILEVPVTESALGLAVDPVDAAIGGDDEDADVERVEELAGRVGLVFRQLGDVFAMALKAGLKLTLDAVAADEADDQRAEQCQGEEGGEVLGHYLGAVIW
jgi:hypothetical protein